MSKLEKRWYAYKVLPIDFNWEYLRTVKETLSIMAARVPDCNPFASVHPASRTTPNSCKSESDSKSSSIFGQTKICDHREPDVERIKLFLNDWEEAKNEASEVDWEGDFRDDPRVFWLPQESEFYYGFVFKQDNNGDTFVVSPFPLPYLEED